MASVRRSSAPSSSASSLRSVCLRSSSSWRRRCSTALLFLAHLPFAVRRALRRARWPPPTSASGRPVLSSRSCRGAPGRARGSGLRSPCTRGRLWPPALSCATALPAPPRVGGSSPVGRRPSPAAGWPRRAASGTRPVRPLLPAPDGTRPPRRPLSSRRRPGAGCCGVPDRSRRPPSGRLRAWPGSR